MKKIYLYGNWKMNMTCGETKDFFAKMSRALEDESISGHLGTELEIAVFPAYTSIASAMAGKGRVIVGAQNVYFEHKGAFTGEVSIPMLSELGCTHVIIGHSERRQIFKESNELLASKLKAVLDAGLTPVFCYGETLEERESGETFNVFREQLTQGLSKLSKDEIERIIFAYEPVWAIGTGKSATSEEAEDACKYSRELISKLSNGAERIVILYGGSVKPDNAKELLSMPDINGALVGGASLKAESFLDIYKAYV
ncbi:MAG: triose-phosphate isomerase [Synergistaceae bacterium]|nr:triose-phosphate isomerase [Synergistaceae bacterium]